MSSSNCICERQSRKELDEKTSWWWLLYRDVCKLWPFLSFRWEKKVTMCMCVLFFKEKLLMKVHVFRATKFVWKAWEFDSITLFFIFYRKLILLREDHGSRGYNNRVRYLSRFLTLLWKFKIFDVLPFFLSRTNIIFLFCYFLSSKMLTRKSYLWKLFSHTLYKNNPPKRFHFHPRSYETQNKKPRVGRKSILNFLSFSPKSIYVDSSRVTNYKNCLVSMI